MSELECTIGIVAAYVSNNSVQPGALPGLIEGVHAAVSDLGKPASLPQAAPPEPAVPIKRSVTQDAIFCLHCGKAFKSLKRHIRGEHGQTPAEYLSTFGLAKDYPMVAPAYSSARSELAKSLGLGRKSSKV